jgi:hypothetical protein
VLSAFAPLPRVFIATPFSPHKMAAIHQLKYMAAACCDFQTRSDSSPSSRARNWGALPSSHLRIEREPWQALTGDGGGASLDLTAPRDYPARSSGRYAARSPTAIPRYERGYVAARARRLVGRAAP